MTNRVSVDARRFTLRSLSSVLAVVAQSSEISFANALVASRGGVSDSLVAKIRIAFSVVRVAAAGNVARLAGPAGVAFAGSRRLVAHSVLAALVSVESRTLGLARGAAETGVAAADGGGGVERIRDARAAAAPTAGLGVEGGTRGGAVERGVSCVAVAAPGAVESLIAVAAVGARQMPGAHILAAVSPEAGDGAVVASAVETVARRLLRARRRRDVAGVAAVLHSRRSIAVAFSLRAVAIPGTDRVRRGVDGAGDVARRAVVVVDLAAVT